ncbi:MAG TPA: PD-(D/E)XK nuclease family protein, partial [Candidatus Brocadiales bacterium]|nr:PD-(D/E)XK nuclease family protein [Candidatus Brocadiales bacterium]
RTHRSAKLTVKNDYIYTVSEILTYNICPRQYYFKYYLGLPEEIPKILPVGEDEDLLRRDEFGMPGHELGNIVHDILNKYDFCKGWHGQTCLSVPQTISESASVLISGWIESFSASKIGKRIRSSQMIESELPFIFNYNGNLIKGRIDLVFGNGDYTILDYKSNNIGEKEIEAHVKHYELQMQLYANALEAIYDYRPKEAILYFLVPGIAVSVDISEGTMAKMQERLDTFLTTAERGEFPIIKGETCNWCAYKKFCC